ncbi:MAG: FISUMP domain-containing protein [Bacteroidales bacterium]|jgi:uncharacterized protein (TIGR02145 family)|nr:FISUMP domain-containing protein [Bacteroidales bacterium]
MKRNIILILSICLFALQYSCQDENENNKPTCTISFPLENTDIMKGQIVTITVDADDKDGNLKEVRFYVDNSGVSSITTFPYKYEWNTSDVDLGNHFLKAEAIDEKNSKTEHIINVNVIDNMINAEFTADKTTHLLGDTINFIDLSTSFPTNWEWDFGDGNTSNEQNPKHVYVNAGKYSVKLTAYNNFTSDTILKIDYITVQTLAILSNTIIYSITNSSFFISSNIISDGYSEIIEKGFYYGISSDPVNYGIKIQVVTQDKIFGTEIKELTNNTTYYFCSYTKNSVGTTYSNINNIITLENSVVTDYDGNDYKIVKIGNQIWMAENLKSTHYADGEVIPLVEDSVIWSNLDSNEKAYCFYGNSTSNANIFGALYNWEATMNGSNSSNSNPSGVQGICPVSWHLPSNNEWVELINYLGGENIAGGKLKEIGLIHWDNPNSGASNESGFTALPSGRRSYNGEFDNLGSWAYYWTSYELYDEMPNITKLRSDSYYVYYGEAMKNFSFSVRCIKD